MESPLRHDAEPELIRQAQSGSTAAVETLIRQSYGQIFTVCRRMCSSREDAEDAAQLAAIAVVRGLPRFDFGSKFSTWVHRISVNASVDVLRKNQRTVPITPLQDGLHLVTDQTAGPEQSTVNQEERDGITQALDELAEEFRVPVILRDLLDWTYHDIAEFLDLSPGTVRSRIHRGRQQLAKLLTPRDAHQQRSQELGN